MLLPSNLCQLIKENHDVCHSKSKIFKHFLLLMTLIIITVIVSSKISVRVECKLDKLTTYGL